MRKLQICVAIGYFALAGYHLYKLVNRKKEGQE